MTLEFIKTTIAAAWVSVVVAVGFAAGVASTPGLVMLAGVAALPSLAMMLLWQDPPQTMSERIREGRH